jgi:hypothetical protein
MAGTYIKEKSKQKYYLIVFALVIIITLVIVWFGFLKDNFTFLNANSAAVSSPVSILPKQANIDFDFLESQELKDLETFNPLSAYEGEIGREQPFFPPSGAIRQNQPAINNTENNE